jgi:hypothetical protein
VNRDPEDGITLVADRLPALVAEHTPLRLARRPGRPRTDVDRAFELTGEGIQYPVWVEVRQSLGVSAVPGLADRAERARAEGAVYLLAAAVLEAPMRRALRDAGVSHADLRGSLYVRAPGVAIRVDAPAGAARRAPAGGEVNPFSDKASLVVRAMLRQPERVWGVRELAGELAISPALVSRVGEAVVRRGYAAAGPGGLSLRDPAAVLMDWASKCPWQRARPRSFLVPYEGAELRHAVWAVMHRLAPSAGALTQTAALELYGQRLAGPGQVHVYCEPIAEEAVAIGIGARLYGEQVPTGGNVHLVAPAQRTSTLFDARTLDGMRVVSPVQLFLDLSGYPLRGAEGAAMLLRTVLRSELRLDGEQVGRVGRFLETL